jgi:hypothetical protein
MIYTSSQDWKRSKAKRILLFGMSGLGKTHISSMLREQNNWFHYSIDYRIGTRYLGEKIVDNCKKVAMKTPFLADLLRSNSIYIASNITFDNLESLSTYLGKPGDISKGGIPLEEYQIRQSQHYKAEQAALIDTAHFINRAQTLYGYQNFICDSSGSICEVVDPWNENDPIMKTLSENLLMVWIKGTSSHTAELVQRFDKAPKPMYYQSDFLLKSWEGYQIETGLSPDKVDPNDFIRWTYSRAMAHRQPRYEQISNWGITVTNEELKKVTSPNMFEELIANALERKTNL